MFDKLKGMKDKASESIKGFQDSESLKNARERLNHLMDKSIESYDSIKTRWIDDSVEDEDAFAEGFQKGAEDVLGDMEKGVAQGPSFYFVRAEKTLKGDYKAGYIAGVDSAFEDL